MKKLGAVIVLLLFASSLSGQSWFEGSFDEAFAKAKQEKKMVLLDFHSKTWGPCIRLVQQVFENENYKEFFNSNFILFKATRGEQVYAELRKKFPIRGTPTVIIFDNTGKEIDRIVGYMPPAEQYVEKLKKYVKNTDAFFSGTFKMAQEKANKENKQLVLFFSSPTWGPCKLLGKQVWNNESYRDFLSSNFVIYKAMKAEGEYTALREKYPFRAHPTILFIDSNGKETDRIVGYAPPAEDFIAKLKRNIATEN